MSASFISNNNNEKESDNSDTVVRYSSRGMSEDSECELLRKFSTDGNADGDVFFEGFDPRTSGDSATGLLVSSGGDVESLREKEREQWDKKIDYILSMVGFAVDLANVWRFPYLCYKNGGGIFLIPYTIFLLLAGIPLFFMELGLGQFNKQGPVTIWKICPLFKGIGYAMMLITLYVMFYYTCIIAWSVYFIARSLTSFLPWTCCGNAWNTANCREQLGNITTNPICDERRNASLLNSTFVQPNLTREVDETDIFKHTPASEFYYREVLHVHESRGIDDLGVPRWELAICLFFVVFLLFAVIARGVRTSGKVVWVTATMPYIVLFILMIRAVTLPGATLGIQYYLSPNITRLGDVEVWTDAATQIFYSLGVGFGVHMTFASYNRFDNNIRFDAIVTSLINCCTSFLSGFMIFSVLGYMAVKNNVDIDKVATDGPGLVFVVYPEVISQIPGAPFWSFVFFVMLLTLGIDSAMGAMEALVTGISDDIMFVKKHRIFFVAGLNIFVYFLAFLNITNGGIYILTLLDTHSAGTSLLFCVFLESTVVAWVYGVDRFSGDIEQMLGYIPNVLWRVCWKFISPAFLLFIVIMSIANYSSMEYGSYKFPSWADTVGWLIAGSSMILVPCVAIYKLSVLPGNFKQKLALSVSPEQDHKSIIEGRLTVKQSQLKHWTAI
ncbi:sodium-dependent noradrenaline transporter-like [Styela clava]